MAQEPTQSIDGGDQGVNRPSQPVSAAINPSNVQHDIDRVVRSLEGVSAYLLSPGTARLATSILEDAITDLMGIEANVAALVESQDLSAENAAVVSEAALSTEGLIPPLAQTKDSPEKPPAIQPIVTATQSSPPLTPPLAAQPPLGPRPPLAPRDGR